MQTFVRQNEEAKTGEWGGGSETQAGCKSRTFLQLSTKGSGLILIKSLLSYGIDLAE